MKFFLSLLALTFICSDATCKETIYRASTTAHPEVKHFLGIPFSDSVDFIRWKLVMRSGTYELDCRYGISKPGTSGFIDEKKASFSGSLTKQGNYYYLKNKSKTLLLLEVNTNLLHLADKHKKMLTGNGGYSCVLNNSTPVKSDQFNPLLKKAAVEYFMTFEGRTPCQELSNLMGKKSSPACDKMKWYVIFYADSVTGKPAYYLQGGRAYKKETMSKGKWEIIRKNGRVIYKIYTDKGPDPLYLLKADDNILFFTDASGNLLVGNENFSYTLNRTKDKEPRN